MSPARLTSDHPIGLFHMKRQGLLHMNGQYSVPPSFSHPLPACSTREVLTHYASEHQIQSNHTPTMPRSSPRPFTPNPNASTWAAIGATAGIVQVLFRAWLLRDTTTTYGSNTSTAVRNNADAESERMATIRAARAGNLVSGLLVIGLATWTKSLRAVGFAIMANGCTTMLDFMIMGKYWSKPKANGYLGLAVGFLATGWAVVVSG
jgi:hypothetical protein